MSWLFLWCLATYSEWLCNILFPWTQEESSRVFHSLAFKASLSQQLCLAFLRVIVFMSQHMLPSVFSGSFIWCFSSPHLLLSPYTSFLKKKKFSETCLYTKFKFPVSHMHACVLGHNLLPWFFEYSFISSSWFNKIPQVFKTFYSRILSLYLCLTIS